MPEKAAETAVHLRTEDKSLSVRDVTAKPSPYEQSNDEIGRGRLDVPS
jgi:hypothetical protein